MFDPNELARTALRLKFVYASNPPQNLIYWYHTAEIQKDKC
jgi:hypothetical protein